MSESLYNLACLAAQKTDTVNYDLLMQQWPNVGWTKNGTDHELALQLIEREGLTSFIAQIDVNQPYQQAETQDQNIITPSDLWLDLPPLEFAVSGFLPSGVLAALCGDGATGKTYTLLDMAVCVATGKDWLNMQVEQGAVLIIDEESGKRRLLKRIQDTMIGHDVPRSTNPPIYAHCKTGFDAGNKEDIAKLDNLLTTTQAKFVILDSLAAITPGLDENSSKAMRPPLDALQALAQKHNAIIFVIHHNNKNGNFRGSSAIRDSVDYLFEVKRQSNTITITGNKTRDYCEDDIDISAIMHFDENIFYLEESQTSATKEALNKIVLIVGEQPGISQNNLAQAIGGQRQEAINMIGYAQKIGKIEDKSKNRYHKYFIPDNKDLELEAYLAMAKSPNE